MGFKKIVIDPSQAPTGFNLTQIQDNVAQSLKEIEFSPLNQGVFVETTLVSGSDNVINTGLGRKYIGFLVVDIDQNTQVWKSQTFNPLKDKQILLRASLNVNVKLYIF